MLRLSDGPLLSDRGHADVGMALSTRAECAVRLKDYVRVNSNRLKQRCLFVVSVHILNDCSFPRVKDDFYQELFPLLSTLYSTDVVVVAGIFNPRLGYLPRTKRHIGS